MPLTPDDLAENTNYFIAKPHVVLRKEKDGSGAVNHLLLGDWLRYKGETHKHSWTTSGGNQHSAIYAKVRARNNDGWLLIDDFDVERALEVNFVDVGQGDGCHIVTPDDEILLIDAGISDNMDRFLSWRYNLRRRNVQRAPDFDPAQTDKGPWMIHHVVMSHPDEDHYGGLNPVFSNLKLSFSRVYHNGIVERPKEPQVPGVSNPWDLGGQWEVDGEKYLFDYVSSTTALKKLVTTHKTTTKRQLTAFRQLFANTSSAKVDAVGVDMDTLQSVTHLPGFEANRKFSLRVLGPIRERKKFDGTKRTTLRRLGNEGETKNGHSVIFLGQYGNLTLMLGGDLNDKSQDFLLQSYAGTAQMPSQVSKALEKLHKKKKPLSPSDLQKLADLEAQQAQIRAAGRAIFEADVAKACHHGSQHVIDEFIEAVNATATVISSGDEESHSHPRPDALGAYGKLGRGKRPLLFSTELARSTREFSPFISSYLEIAAIVMQIESELDVDRKEQLIGQLEAKKDRNVAVYGMITLRALGDTVVIAQKLESPRSDDQKWDIYELEYDQDLDQFVYDAH